MLLLLAVNTLAHGWDTAGLLFLGGAAMLLSWVLLLSKTAQSPARKIGIAERQGRHRAATISRVADDFGKQLLHAFSLSVAAAAIGMVALACGAAIALPPLDSDYRPGSLVEWILYGALVVPCAAVLGAKATAMAVKGYEATWQFISRDLMGRVFDRGDPPSR